MSARSDTNGNGNGFHRAAPATAWTAQENGALYVPRIDWSLAGLQEERAQYDITVKLFFLPTAPVSDRAQHARAALDHVLRELAVPDVDLLVVSFPGMSASSSPHPGCPCRTWAGTSWSRRDPTRCSRA